MKRVLISEFQKIAKTPNTASNEHQAQAVKIKILKVSLSGQN